MKKLVKVRRVITGGFQMAAFNADQVLYVSQDPSDGGVYIAFTHSDGDGGTSPLGIKSPEEYAEIVAKINGQWKREWWLKAAQLLIGLVAVIGTLLYALR